MSQVILGMSEADLSASFAEIS